MFQESQLKDSINAIYVELKYLNKPIRYISFSDIALLNHLTGLVRGMLNAHICKIHHSRARVRKNFIDGRWVAEVICCCSELRKSAKDAMLHRNSN